MALRIVRNTSTDLRVGVIGAGYWGPNLVRNLMEVPGARCAAVADLDPDRLAAIAGRYPGVRTTTDYHTLLTDPSIEAVCIATPTASHRRLAVQALQAGKHVFVEQPLAGSVDDADTIVAASYSAARFVMVGHTSVYNPAVETVRGLLRRGALGDLRYVDSQRVNLGLHQFDFSVLWDLGPHEVSTVLYWLDEQPEWVQAVGACFTQDAIEDVVFLTLGFPSGAIAHAHLSWLAPRKVRRIAVIGSQKMVICDEDVPAERVKVYDRGVERLSVEELRRSYRAGDVHTPRVPQVEPLQVEMRHFVACVRGEAVPLSDGETGVHVVKVLEAASRSLRAGGTRIACDAQRGRSATVPALAAAAGSRST